MEKTVRLAQPGRVGVTQRVALGPPGGPRQTGQEEVGPRETGRTGRCDDRVDKMKVREESQERMELQWLGTALGSALL